MSSRSPIDTLPVQQGQHSGLSTGMRELVNIARLNLLPREI